jgi:hypothetical protein
MELDHSECAAHRLRQRSASVSRRTLTRRLADLTFRRAVVVHHVFQVDLSALLREN